MKKLIIDTSSEMLLKRSGNGIQLIKPNNNYQNQFCSVAKVFELPMTVHFLDTSCIIRNLNEFAVNVCGYLSKKATIGKTCHFGAKKEAADIIIQQDFEILQKNQTIIKEQHFIRKSDDAEFPAIGIRYPLYDEQKSIIGVFTLAMVIRDSELSLLTQALNSLIELGLLGNARNYADIFSPCKIIHGTYLSQREFECVKLLIKGKTTKMIAQVLGLSPRTVEHYIENTRNKLGITSKAELIDVVINHILDQV